MAGVGAAPVAACVQAPSDRCILSLARGRGFGASCRGARKRAGINADRALGGARAHTKWPAPIDRPEQHTQRAQLPTRGVPHAPPPPGIALLPCQSPAQTTISPAGRPPQSQPLPLARTFALHNRPRHAAMGDLTSLWNEIETLTEELRGPINLVSRPPVASMPSRAEPTARTGVSASPGSAKRAAGGHQPVAAAGGGVAQPDAERWVGAHQARRRRRRRRRLGVCLAARVPH